MTNNQLTPLGRTDLEGLAGLTLLEFGASWCSYCQAAAADIVSVLSRHPQIRHIKIEDGKGQPLGRSYRVKLWPTLILLENGAEIGRLERPQSAEAINCMLTGQSSINGHS